MYKAYCFVFSMHLSLQEAVCSVTQAMLSLGCALAYAARCNADLYLQASLRCCHDYSACWLISALVFQHTLIDAKDLSGPLLVLIAFHCALCRTCKTTGVPYT